ncbi:MAG: hypothetical protein IID32_03480 [Planctomycetes bacterium]|nr:hypothetical protein [Planctomycetota bacterium]
MRRKRNGFLWGLSVLLAAAVSGLSGCLRLNDYVIPPTIVDASTGMVYTPGRGTASQGSEPGAQKVESRAVAFGNVRSQPSRYSPRAQSSSPTGVPGNSIYYQYDPGHSRADENGLVQIANPNQQKGAASNAKFAMPNAKLTNRIPAESRLELKQAPAPQIYSQVPQFIAQSEPATVAVSGRTEVLRVTDVQVSVVGSSITPVRLETNEETLLPLRVSGTPFTKETPTETPDTGPVNLLQLAVKQGTSLKSKPQVVQVAVQQKQEGPGQVNHFDAMVAQLHKNLVRNPDDGVSQLALRTLYLAYGMNDKALGLLPSLPREKQTDAIGLARSLHLAAQSMRPENQSRTDLANRALAAWWEQGERIADRADLIIANLKVCRDKSVRGFGLYEVIPDSLLKTGEPRTIQIYCELQNFKSRLDSDGKYTSKIAAQVTLYNAKDFGRTLAQLKWSEVPDVPSYNRRRDFFFRGPLKLPRLKPGQYEIVVEVEDRQAAKTARPGRLKFEVK